jgi:hypothetical protein
VKKSLFVLCAIALTCSYALNRYIRTSVAQSGTIQNVVWTSLVNCAVTGDVLQKTSGCDGCPDAGAVSTQTISAGNGYVEFKATDTATLRFIGLSNGNPGTSIEEIKFALALRSGIVEVYESGVYKADTPYFLNDMFRISVEAGQVKYYRNGAVFYTSNLAPSYPLLVDTSLLNLNATIANAKLFTSSPPSSGGPNPTLLPVATTSQVPLTAQYNALNVPSLSAGGSYLDPTTGVKIYKLTSATYPAPNLNCGHDYAEGGAEVSRPYSGSTRAILAHQDGDTGGPYWLIDFTPGVGVSNPRQLTGLFAPQFDLAFAFSNNPATPYYAYVYNGSSIRRFDIRTMTDAPGNGWPVTGINATDAVWLHQSEDDSFFVWMLGGNGNTIVGYEPGSGALKTHTDVNLNEPRIDRAGRYVGISMDNNGLKVWDWNTNTITWTTTGDPGIPFAHNASLRRRWLGVNWNSSFPPPFAMFTPDVPNSGEEFGAPANAHLVHGSGNWIQPTAAFNDQWALFYHYGSLQPVGTGWLSPGGMVLITRNGERRLLGHPYNTGTTYNYLAFAKFSPDGKYVLFTSNMNGSGRNDLFLAELP